MTTRHATICLSAMPLLFAIASTAQDEPPTAVTAERSSLRCDQEGAPDPSASWLRLRAPDARLRVPAELKRVPSATEGSDRSSIELQSPPTEVSAEKRRLIQRYLAAAAQLESQLESRAEGAEPSELDRARRQLKRRMFGVRPVGVVATEQPPSDGPKEDP